MGSRARTCHLVPCLTDVLGKVVILIGKKVRSAYFFNVTYLELMAPGTKTLPQRCGPQSQA